MQVEIAVIKEKAAELKALDKRYSVFGSSRHRYEFNSILLEEELEAFERLNDIKFNKEYKAFLTTIGNGGIGCGYGLEALSIKRVTEPYPGSNHLMRNWDGRSDLDVIDIDEVTGVVKLFDYGCGMEVCLVVKGQEVGAMIQYDCDGRFQTLKSSLFQIYDYWLTREINDLEDIKQKMQEMPILTLIEQEWQKNNFNIREMIYSIADIDAPNNKVGTDEYDDELILLIDAWKLSLVD